MSKTAYSQPDVTTPLLHSINNNDDNEDDNPKCGVFQFRYAIVFFSMFGCFCAYTIRTCMGIAMVCMVNHTALFDVSHDTLNYSDTIVVDTCVVHPANETDSTEDGPFIWDENLQGIILSSFFWGYAIPQCFAGFLADKFGGKWIWGCCLLLSSIFTLMIPVAAHQSAELVIMLRALCGLTQGVTFPSLFSILSKWVPQQERSKLVTLCITGSSFGIIVCFPLSAALCKSSLGWSSIFYVFGSIGVLWFLIWSLCAADYPATHSWVSKGEKVLIQNNTRSGKDSTVLVPWKRILTSPPFLSLWFIELFASFKFFMLLTQLPTYLKVVMGFDADQNGLINLIPYAITIPVSLLSGWLADTLKNSGMLRTGTIRKSLCFISLTTSSLGLIGVTLAGCDRSTVVILVWISVAADAFGAGGASINPFDLSPSFTGTLKGLANTFAAVGGILAPYIVGLLINGNNTIEQWNIAFYLASGCSILGAVIFLMFGSGNVQPWDASYKAPEETDPIAINSDDSLG